MSKLIPSLQSFAKGAAATVAGVSTLTAGLLWWGQGYLIYPSAVPPGARTDVPKPSQWRLPYEDLELLTPDGVTLRCYMLRQRKDLSEFENAVSLVEDTDATISEKEFAASRPTVMMFHGNAGNHGHRIPLAYVFYIRMRCNVLMMCYRGYGLSDGTPNERGLQTDAQTGLDYLLNCEVLKQTPIILYGQSIGGAVSVDLASKNPDKITALILENTFTSLPNLVPHVFPILGPFSFLCHQKWDSVSKVSLIPTTMPILMLSGTEDQIVPKEHMHALWQAFAKRGEKTTSSGKEYKDGVERTKLVEFRHGGHNDTCVQPGYWAAIREFLVPFTKIPLSANF